MTKGKYIRTPEHRAARSLRMKAYYAAGGVNHRSMAGKKHSEETKKKMSAYHKANPVRYWLGKHPSHLIGKNNSNYIDGRYPENRKVRDSLQYVQWRKEVFERDNYTCVLCGVRSCRGLHVELNADHIKPFSKYKELRFDINNGRTLCVGCHRNTETWGRKALYQQ